MMIHFWRCKRLQLVWVCIEPKIQILVWIYYGCLESTKELLRLPLTTTGRAERSRKKGNPNSWGTLVRGLKTNLPSSSTVENLHSYSLKPVMILSNSRNALTSRLLHNICIDLVFYIGLLFLRELWSLWIDFGLIYHSWDRYRFCNPPTFRSFDFYNLLLICGTTSLVTCKISTLSNFFLYSFLIISGVNKTPRRSIWVQKLVSLCGTQKAKQNVKSGMFCKE